MYKYIYVAHCRKLRCVANLLQIYNKKTIYKHKYRKIFINKKTVKHCYTVF